MPLLKLRRLAKHFGGLPAVDGVDLEVGQGQIVAIIGPNGAGKTTLLSLVAGLTAPSTCEEFRFAGHDLRGAAPHRIRRAGIATVRQSPAAFGSMSVREDVAVGARFGDGRRPSRARAFERADVELATVGLRDRADDPVTVLNLHGLRMLALARALASRPSLLLLDEPMAGLTPGELDHAVALLRRLRDERGLTVVWVEHVMPAVDALADRVVVMDMGQVLADGDPASVRRDPAVVTAYLGTPAGTSGTGDA